MILNSAYRREYKSCCPYCGRDQFSSYGCYDDFCHFIYPLSDSEELFDMPITDKELDNWFRYHRPGEDGDPEDIQDRYEKIRAAGGEMSKVILELTPNSADQSAAIRKVREAVMTANAALACKGK